MVRLLRALFCWHYSGVPPSLSHPFRPHPAISRSKNHGPREPCSLRVRLVCRAVDAQGRAYGRDRSAHAECPCPCVIEYYQGLSSARAGETIPVQLLQPYGAHRRKGLYGQSLSGVTKEGIVVMVPSHFTYHPIVPVPVDGAARKNLPRSSEELSSWITLGHFSTSPHGITRS